MDQIFNMNMLWALSVAVYLARRRRTPRTRSDLVALCMKCPYVAYALILKRVIYYYSTVVYIYMYMYMYVLCTSMISHFAKCKKHCWPVRMRARARATYIVLL